MDPIYEVDGIIHYCVANMPGAVPKTSTISLTNSTSSYIIDLLKEDFSTGKISNTSISSGINIYRGEITHKGLAESFNMPYKNIEKIQYT